MAPANPHSGYSRTNRPHYARAYSEAIEIQATLKADIDSSETTPAARAQLARAWDTLEERKRILRNRPLPGSLKPEPKSKTKRKAQAIAEPIE